MPKKDRDGQEPKDETQDQNAPETTSPPEPNAPGEKQLTFSAARSPEKDGSITNVPGESEPNPGPDEGESAVTGQIDPKTGRTTAQDTIPKAINKEGLRPEGKFSPTTPTGAEFSGHAPHSPEAQAVGPRTGSAPLNPRAQKALRDAQEGFEKATPNHPLSQAAARKVVAEKEARAPQGALQMPEPLNEPVDTVHLSPREEGGPPEKEGQPNFREQLSERADGEEGEGRPAPGGRFSEALAPALRSISGLVKIDALLGDVFGDATRLGEVFRRLASQHFGRRLQAELADQLARQWTKQLDGLVEHESGTFDQRVALAEGLAGNAKGAAEMLAEIIAGYPALSARVVELKEANDPSRNAELIAARLERKKAQDAIQDALTAIGQALAGQDIDED